MHSTRQKTAVKKLPQKAKIWMKSSSHVFTDRLFMLFPWLWRRVLVFLFHTLL